MRKLNPAHIDAVIHLCNEGNFFKLLSMKVRKLNVGYCLVELDVEEKHLNPFGGVHGGVYASLIDTATFWSVYLEIEEDAGLITIDLQVDLLAPIKEGKLIIEGKRIKVGRNICIAEATVLDESGKKLAHGKSKQMVTKGLQTINQAVKELGLVPLPPKFL